MKTKAVETRSEMKFTRVAKAFAQRQGYDVIITVATSASFGVQQHIREDLRGLKYAFANQGLNEHPKYLEWIETTVEERLAAAAD